MLPTQDSLVHNYDVFHGGPGGTKTNDVARPVALGSNLPLDEAYARSAEVMRRISKQWQTPLAGYKISMTNTADQAPVGATEPAYGLLTAAHLRAVTHTIELAAANSALVEPELVVRALSDLSEQMSDDELLASLEVTAGLEVPVCRIPGWWPEGQRPAVTLSDFLLDNAAAGFVVHGRAWTPASSLDLTALTVDVSDPAGTRHAGTSDRVLGSPVNAVRWLTGALARHGRAVTAGSVIATGTFMTPLRAAAGDYTATFSDGLGTVTARFL